MTFDKRKMLLLHDTVYRIFNKACKAGLSGAQRKKRAWHMKNSAQKPNRKKAGRRRRICDAVRSDLLHVCALVNVDFRARERTNEL